MKNYLYCLILGILLVSCGNPHYLECPTIYYPIIKNECSFGVQNMDNAAKIEQSNLIAHYNDFDVQYNVSDLVPSLVIINNSNKSLIIDKSKSFVLYDGYSVQLFKDVRSTKSTTFNNVQDAINNVSTNDASVTMSIPPYSKWELPLPETNVRKIEKLSDFQTNPGKHNLSPYDNKESVEFVIPYTFDYSLAKWETCRNRLYVSVVDVVRENVVDKELYNGLSSSESLLASSSNVNYVLMMQNGYPDYTEANRIDEVNYRKYKIHDNRVICSQVFWMILFSPTVVVPLILHYAIDEYGCTEHLPTFCGDKRKNKYQYDE